MSSRPAAPEKDAGPTPQASPHPAQQAPPNRQPQTSLHPKIARWFEEHRSHLLSIAYRMTGTLSDAEDALQDLLVKLHRVDPTSVKQPRAYLCRAVTRQCIDQLTSARARREQYVGPWLPEPLVLQAGLASEQKTAADYSDLSENVSHALMMALERLSPLERAAFLLHDVFDVSYEEIATTLGREQATCRQLATRGRKHIKNSRPRFDSTPEQTERLLSAFAQATTSGDLQGLQALLTADVVHYSDGGGRVAAATKPIVGHVNVARFLLGIVRKFDTTAGALSADPALINGQPGFVIKQGGAVIQTLAFEFQAGKISALYAMRNPEKLRHLNESPSGLNSKRP